MIEEEIVTMADNGEKGQQQQTQQQFSESKYALDGIQMWLNNRPLEAEEYFRRRKSSLQVEAGYTFLSFLVRTASSVYFIIRRPMGQFTIGGAVLPNY